MPLKMNFSISGTESSQRLHKVLEQGQTIRVGRTAKQGWEIPWDRMISREHADLSLDDGRLRVQCLEAAGNPIIYRSQSVREALVAPNEWFQIGHTTFHASSLIDSESDEAAAKVSAPVEFLSLIHI